MRDARRVIDCGIIPALAGNIIDLWDEKNAATDHPRACGEHDGTWAEPYNCRGSSPRLRGTSRPHARRCACPQDHPRACGEHSFVPTFRNIRAGSSPRLRGTCARERERENLGGIIPALAGNIQIGFTVHEIDGDHPRACGEHDLLSKRIAIQPGSSPRLRGTCVERVLDEFDEGIIPALAGNIHSRFRGMTCD